MRHLKNFRSRALRTAGVVATSAMFSAVVASPASAAQETQTSVEENADCTEVGVEASRDISNVVLAFADGDTERFEGGAWGQAAEFAGTGDNAGEAIETVWVKAGDNASGDGPGYGERHDLSCEIEPTSDPAPQDEPQDPGTPEDDPAPDDDGQDDGGQSDEAQDVTTDATFLGESCAAVQVSASKDISNVVLEFVDGTRQRFENGGWGTEAIFAGTEEHDGKTIGVVWVKAGDNASGDGPGYGERHDAPDSCTAAQGGGDEGPDPQDEGQDPAPEDEGQDPEPEDEVQDPQPESDEPTEGDPDETAGDDTPGDDTPGDDPDVLGGADERDDGDEVVAADDEGVTPAVDPADEVDVLGIVLENDGDAPTAAPTPTEPTATIAGEALPRTGVDTSALAAMAMLTLAGGSYVLRRTTA